jgi:membrane-associated phospholipid phosphatase
MNHLSVTNKVIYLVLFCSFAAGYFALTDLQISISIVNQNAEWAIFLEKFGEIPGLLVLFFGIHIYLANTFSIVKTKSLLISTILFFAAIFLSGYLIIVLGRGFSDWHGLILEYRLLSIAVILFLNVVIVYRMKEIQFAKKKLTFAKATVLLGLYGYLFLILPLKILWGRVRFRDLDPLYESFTSWFIPNGINSNQSFPSGHSAMAWMILPLILLVYKKSVVRKLVLTIISAWGLTVGISRVVIGAHFPSDVLFGAFLVILIYMLLINKYLQEY